MALILINHKDRELRVRINRDRWYKVILLICSIAWTPAGTLPPHGWSGDGPWDPMDYLSGAGQLVTERDALGIAKGIEKLTFLIIDITREFYSDSSDDMWGPVKHQKWEYLTNLGFFNEKLDFLFSERMGQKLQDLITFCKQGAFEIHHIDP